jgi:hypothetical protein
MGVKETLGDTIRIVIVIHMLMVVTMFAGPKEYGIFKRPGSENQSMPKNQRYKGTAVIDRNKVPMRKELMSQLTRSKGIRGNMGLICCQSASFRIGSNE